MIRSPRCLSVAAAWPLLVLFAGCRSTFAPMPTLADYTEGASWVADEVEKRLEGEGSSRLPGNSPAVAVIEARAMEWARSGASRREARVRIVDFPPDPGRRATMVLEAQVEGNALDGLERLHSRDRFVLELERRRDGWVVAGSRADEATPIRRSRPRFREVSAEIGLAGVVHEVDEPLEATNISMPATHHHAGILATDLDGDGDVDLLVPGRENRLFLNDGSGHFRDATAGSGLDRLPPSQASGVAAADLDGDGLPEIFLARVFAPSLLLGNLGGGRFRDRTAEAGLAALSGPLTSAVFFDADRDGRLDLFVAAYGDARVTGPDWDGTNGWGSRFFRGAGNGGAIRFVDETRASGIADGGWAFAASATDADGDGDDDLYVACDFGANRFWRNLSTPGHPSFRDDAAALGIEDEGFGMGVAWGDANGDGRWDLHVSNFWSPYLWILRSSLLPMPDHPLGWLARRHVVEMLRHRTRGDSLFVQRPDGRFDRASDASGVIDGSWAWGCEFGDLDGDGDDDLVVANGMFDPMAGGKDDEVVFWNGMTRHGIDFREGLWGTVDLGRHGAGSGILERLFLNDGAGRFDEVAFVEGLDGRSNARGLALADLDGDRAPEILVASFRGPLLVYRNGFAPANRIAVRLRGASPGNRDAIGAELRARADGRLLLRAVRAGSSYLSQSPFELLLGLGQATVADEIEVRWPSGRRERVEGVPAGSVVEWTEGEPPTIRPGEGGA